LTEEDKIKEINEKIENLMTQLFNSLKEATSNKDNNNILSDKTCPFTSEALDIKQQIDELVKQRKRHENLLNKSSEVIKETNEANMNEIKEKVTDNFDNIKNKIKGVFGGIFERKKEIIEPVQAGGKRK
jgi:ElaB/YqjD/DUF883 family membrane-anchored ribosome-binding protein